ncbi:MAG: hypothetical protein SFW67_33515 [Myxococcaceae bacterium]|nr:hypothetical protein [Myxococcaceae bacterium]
MRPVVLVAAALLAGCLDVTVPMPPPAPGPGSLQGTVVYSVPGRTGTRPAGGATVTLVGTSRRATADAETGRFELDGLTRSTGQVLFAFDADGDGVVDRQKVLELSAVGAGRGKTVALGEVALGRNGAVVGRVLRADVAGPGGHAGTAVFVAGLPLATASNDRGDYVLENLPEGQVTVSFFRAGSRAEAVDLAVRSGQESQASTVRLEVDPMAASAAPARLTGTLRFEDDSPVANARLQLVSGAFRVTTTTGPTGAFSVEASQAALFQVGIEADGAQSLVLTNVLLLPGTTDLGVVPLTRGTSTPIDFDGGFNPGTPDAGAGVIAVIDPPVLEVTPGGMGVLSSARSTGTRPLTSRWRSEHDGGLALTFATPTTTGAVTSFTAPDASGVFTIGLEVVDATGAVSSETTSLVRVGRRPDVMASASPMQAFSGDPVRLDATAQSTDGRPISEYRWVQRSGPTVPGVLTTFAPTFTFTAPTVPGVIPMTFEVTARTDIGFESLPLALTVEVRPRGAPMLVVTATPPSATWTGASPQQVQLTATLSGGAPGDPITYAWSPRSQSPCPLPDGGLDGTCPSAVTLSNDTGPFTEFFAPQVSGDRTVRFTVTARGSDGGVLDTRDLDFLVRDRRPPSCRTNLTRLALRVQCDEPIGSGLMLDGGANTPLHSLAVDGGLALFFFETFPAGPLTLGVSGLADSANNPPTSPVVVPPTPSLDVSPVWTSGQTSLADPRPLWVPSPASTGAPSRRFVIGRRTDASARSVWLWDPENTCGTPPCETLAMPIAMAGLDPGPALPAVVLGTRAFVITSRTNPNALVELAGGTPREFLVSTMPPLVGLSAIGSDLWVLSEDGGALVRRRLVGSASDGGALGPAEAVNDGFNGTLADVFASPDGREAAAGVVDAMPTFRFRGYDPQQASWGTFGELALPGGAAVTAVRGAWLGAGAGLPVWFTSDAMGALRVDWEQPSTPPAPASFTLSMNDSKGQLDAVRFGNAVLVAWVTFGGELRLTLMSTDPTSLPVDLPSSATSTRWNDVEQAFHPRLTVTGDEVLLTWSVGGGAGPWRMKARTLR